MTDKALIRPLEEADFADIFEIFQAVLAPGDVFPYPESTTLEQFKEIWTPPGSFSYVALCDGELRGKIGGAYYVKPQWPGRGSHVATATYMVAPWARGRGIGLELGQHSLGTARACGYRAMQFNLVISTNKPAVALWQKIGFKIVGTVPQAFDHANLGPVDTYLMHRLL